MISVLVSTQKMAEIYWQSNIFHSWLLINVNDVFRRCLYHMFNILQMSDIVNMDIRPTPETSLEDMLSYGLTKNLEK